MRWFLPALIVLTFCFDYQNDVHWPPWAMLDWILAGLITWRLIDSKKIPISAALLFGWALTQGLSFMEWRPLTQDMPFEQKAAIRLTAAHATVELLLLAGVFYTQWPRIRKAIALGLFFGGLLHTLFLIFDQAAPLLIPSLPQELFATKGLLGNRSIGASFTVVWFFFSLHLLSTLDLSRRVRQVVFYGSLLAIPAVLISSSGISYLALIAGLAATALAVTPRHAWSIPRALALLASLTIAVSLGSYVKPQFFEHMSRYDAWPMFMKWHWENTNMFLGAGAGTFKFYGPHIQETLHYMEGRWWLWLHSDWLQIICEYGFIGAALSGITYFQLVTSALKRPLLLGAVVAYGTIAVANYPFHIAITALLGFWLFFEGIWSKQE